MKILLYFVPVLMIVLSMTIGTRLLGSGQISPMVLVLMMLGMFAVSFLLRPKNKGTKPASEVEQKVRGDFAKDAFANDPKLGAMFQAAIKDYSSNMPKAALSKLTKLASQCTGDKERYAVAMATAQCHLIIGKPLPAVREYTKALNIHPSADVALKLGSCHQRLGNLDKARDSYEYALDLEDGNLEALSRIATTYVADHDFRSALDYANRVLDAEETNSSALATAAICHGLLNDSVLCKYYTDLAVENGYSKNKIEETISVLKKRVK